MTRVLLIEDDASLRKTYESQLKREGFEVTSASNARDAKRLLINERFDVAVSDTEIGNGKWGDKLFRGMKGSEQTKGMLIIGMSSARDYEEYWKDVASDFIHKNRYLDLGVSVREKYARFRVK